MLAACNVAQGDIPDAWAGMTKLQVRTPREWARAGIKNRHACLVLACSLLGSVRTPSHTTCTPGALGTYSLAPCRLQVIGQPELSSPALAAVQESRCHQRNMPTVTSNLPAVHVLYATPSPPPYRYCNWRATC
jgi:hypothetical protein